MPGGRGVGVEPALEDVHQLRRPGVVEVGEPTVVVARVHEDLVGAGRLGDHVDRPDVVDDEPGPAAEGRVQVGDHPHLPGAGGIDGVEGGQRGVLVAGAERAGSLGVRFDGRLAGSEVMRSMGAVGDDGHPTAVERVQSHLSHSCDSGYDGTGTEMVHLNPEVWAARFTGGAETR